MISSVGYPGICRQFAGNGCEHICLPLQIGGDTGAIVQFVCSNRLPPAKFKGRVETAQRFIKEAVPVVEAKLLTERLRERATRDLLTGPHNRRYLEECDLDHVKRVNDAHGHRTGDLVLRDVAKVLRRVARSSDVVVRYGGEEFTGDADAFWEALRWVWRSTRNPPEPRQPGSWRSKAVGRPEGVGRAETRMIAGFTSFGTPKAVGTTQ